MWALVGGKRWDQELGIKANLVIITSVALRIRE